jgi:diaminohydroxyphosphoribosylaminopyrimidine deaminase/5-amino-6-(5-phosphoribosylamino)uracil reductase
MTITAEDARHMARAIELARRGLYTTDPNPRVGCVIAKGGEVVGEGWHERAGEPHAEVNALKAAGAHARGATAYVTLEPCCHHGRTPPCSQALIKAGVRRVVAAMRDPNPAVGGKGFDELERHGVTVDSGLMEREAEALNPGFLMRMRKGRPFVRIKLAASLDGRTALADGRSEWITGEPARADVQRLRARSSAILTGVSTVLTDDPQLNVRDIGPGDTTGHTHAAGGTASASIRQPLRVILDSQLRTPPQARILRQPGATLVVASANEATRAARLREAGAEVLILSRRDHGMDLDALMTHLATREVNELHVEAGATLAGSLLAGGYVDELVLYYAPNIMGSHERGMFALPPLLKMADRVELEIVDVRAVGRDWRVTAKVVSRET